MLQCNYKIHTNHEKNKIHKKYINNIRNVKFTINSS